MIADCFLLAVYNGKIQMGGIDKEHSLGNHYADNLEKLQKHFNPEDIFERFCGEKLLERLAIQKCKEQYFCISR